MSSCGSGCSWKAAEKFRQNELTVNDDDDDVTRVGQSVQRCEHPHTVHKGFITEQSVGTLERTEGEEGCERKQAEKIVRLKRKY